MQPNNQNPYQQGQNPPPSNTPPQVTGYAGANVPEYLHLDPIAEPKSPKKRTIVVTLMILGVVAAIGTAVVFVWLKQSEPSRVFYESVSRMLQTPVLAKSYNFSSERDKGSLSAVIKTKYSSDKNSKESIISYKYSQQYVVNDNPKVDSIEGDIVLNSTGRMAKLSKYPDSFNTGAYKINQWYRAAPEVSDFWELYDPMSLIDVSDTNSGLMPAGFYDDRAVKEILSYLKNAEIYTITKAYSTDKEYIYSVRTSDVKIAKFNTELSRILGTTKPDPNRTYKNTERIINISIDKKDGRMSSLSFEGTEDKLDILFAYPQDDVIETPSLSNVIKVGV